MSFWNVTTVKSIAGISP